jgi:hypothetical protein
MAVMTTDMTTEGPVMWQAANPTTLIKVLQITKTKMDYYEDPARSCFEFEFSRLFNGLTFYIFAYL